MLLLDVLGLNHVASLYKLNIPVLLRYSSLNFVEMVMSNKLRIVALSKVLFFTSGI